MDAIRVINHHCVHQSPITIAFANAIVFANPHRVRQTPIAFANPIVFADPIVFAKPPLFANPIVFAKPRVIPGASDESLSGFLVTGVFFVLSVQSIRTLSELTKSKNLISAIVILWSGNAALGTDNKAIFALYTL